MTTWVMGLILRPKAYEGAHYKHRHECMQTLLFNEAHYGPFRDVFGLYLSNTYGP